jgi:uncharacterized protein (DUF305 family)
MAVARLLRAAGHPAALGALVLVLITGCGGPPPEQGPAASAGTAVAPATPAPDLGYNVADVVFLQQMIGHHELAIQLAQEGKSRGREPQLRQLAETVLAESDGEVRQMSIVLRSLGIDLGAAAFGGSHAHSGGPTAEDVTALAGKSGSDFDRAFVGLMLEHSLGATQLARAEAQEGSNTALKRFAAGIAQRESDRTITLAALPT